ncbi:MAG: hypothetical protein H6Q29_183 [Bacteroidetes bacterium]|nr:hypothetical protein [Bacteroidota bacterium]
MRRALACRADAIIRAAPESFTAGSVPASISLRKPERLSHLACPEQYVQQKIVGIRRTLREEGGLAPGRDILLERIAQPLFLKADGLPVPVGRLDELPAPFRDPPQRSLSERRTARVPQTLEQLESRAAFAHGIRASAFERAEAEEDHCIPLRNPVLRIERIRQRGPIEPPGVCQVARLDIRVPDAEQETRRETAFRRHRVCDAERISEILERFARVARVCGGFAERAESPRYHHRVLRASGVGDRLEQLLRRVLPVPAQRCPQAGFQVEACERAAVASGRRLLPELGHREPLTIDVVQSPVGREHRAEDVHHAVLVLEQAGEPKRLDVHFHCAPVIPHLAMKRRGFKGEPAHRLAIGKRSAGFDGAPQVCKR